MKAIEEARKRCGELLAIPDQALAHKPYFPGNSLTIGDIPLGCHVHLWMRLPIERPAHANLSRWFERLCTRAAFKKIVDIPLS
jgi:glutathione S-transferase